MTRTAENTDRKRTKTPQGFNLRLESTMENTIENKMRATPNASNLDLANSTFRMSKTPAMNKRRSSIKADPQNALSLHYPVNKSDFLKQVRKHFNLVQTTNKFEDQFLGSKHASNFSTINPLNVFYQIAMNPDYSFKPD